MKIPFLTFIAFCISITIAQDSDGAIELLPPDVFKNEVLRRELALQGMENAKDTLVREFLNAAVLYYDKKWDKAYSAYLPLLEKAPALLYGPLAIRLAKCELERGNIQESRKILLNIKSIKNNRNSWEQADRVLVEGILLDTAIEQSAKIDSMQKRLKFKPSEKYEQFLKWKVASMQITEKSAQDNAIEYYYAILKYNGQYADSAFNILQWLAPKSTNYEFVKILCRKGYNEKCAEKISSILADKKTKLDSARKVNLMVWQAEAFKQLSKTNLAIEAYKTLLDSVDYNTIWMQSLLRLVRSTGNKSEAKRLDSIFQKKFPFSAENANNLWVKAFEYEQAKDYKKATETYKRLYDARFGKHKPKQWAKFRVGFISFKEEKYEEAAIIFAEAANENLGLMPRSAALYFYAECQRILENREAAAKAYFAVIADFPLGYYSWRAKQSIKEFDMAESILSLGQETPDSLVAVWVRNLQKKAGEKDTLISTERLEQIGFLLRSGFEHEAFALYDESLNLHKNRPEFYYRYGTMFMQNGEYALSHRLARNFLDIVSREKMVKVPMQILKFLYPLPHEAKVKKHTKIDPYLVYSVMRQESMFDAQITSPAGARGLLQIMPATGDALAKLERIERFDKDLLYNAYMNIHLGVRYLNDLHTEYKGDYIGVLGNYNAGPAPAARWLANHGSLPWDIRVEEVSYWETRDYVKRVMGNYWTYKEIYN